MDDFDLYNLSDELIDSNESYEIKEVDRKFIMNQIKFEDENERRLTEHIIKYMEKTVANNLKRHKAITLPFMVWFNNPKYKSYYKSLERSTV